MSETNRKSNGISVNIAAKDVLAVEWKAAKMQMNICGKEVIKMIDYSFFYDIAAYANENWNGNFTIKEIACYAYKYLMEFKESKARGSYHVMPVIQELLALLDEDGSEQCTKWADRIRRGLGLCMNHI